MNILEPCSGRHKFSKQKYIYIKDETNWEKKKLPFTDGIKSLEEIFFKTNSKLVGLTIEFSKKYESLVKQIFNKDYYISLHQ